MNNGEYYTELYRRNFPNKDKLDEIKRVINWEVFRPILNACSRTLW